ncbi:MAG: hypothetical protein ACK4ZJ_17230, partial [Allorhizobium sp.]
MRLFASAASPGDTPAKAMLALLTGTAPAAAAAAAAAARVSAHMSPAGAPRLAPAPAPAAAATPVVRASLLPSAHAATLAARRRGRDEEADEAFHLQARLSAKRLQLTRLQQRCAQLCCCCCCCCCRCLCSTGIARVALTPPAPPRRHEQLSAERQRVTESLNAVVEEAA